MGLVISRYASETGELGSGVEIGPVTVRVITARNGKVKLYIEAPQTFAIVRDDAKQLTPTPENLERRAS